MSKSPALTFIVGTAAELIKLFPVIKLALANDASQDVQILATGQSRQNLIMQYRDFNLPESRLTFLMNQASDLEQAGKALSWFLRAITQPRRNFASKLRGGTVVVHGDTLSTLIGAWLGRRAKLKVAHIEAGLRSPSMLHPFPEEITRRMVSRLAHYHFAPDAVAEANLRRAVAVRGEIVCTGGNTLLDAVLMLNSASHSDSASGSDSASVSSTPSRAFALVNVHRFENLNSAQRWSQIIDTVVAAAQKVSVIFIAHPQTRHKLDNDLESAGKLKQAGVSVRDRVPFSEFISLLHHAAYLISDGGSNQEECSYLGKPCLLLREHSERREGLDSCCCLSRFDPNVIRDFIDSPTRFQRPPLVPKQSPSALILDVLRSNR